MSPDQPAPGPDLILGIPRAKLFQWITILIIAAFVLELFAVLLSTPTQPTVTPTPTGTPKPEAAFEGVGAGSARVLKLGSDLLVECEGVPREALDGVRAVPGVTFALPSPGGNVVNVRLNASLAEESISRAMEGVEDALWRFCEPRVYRVAELLLEGSTNVTSPTTNRTRIFNQRTLSTLFQQVGFRSVVGWVTPKTVFNESIGVALVVRLRPGEDPFVFLQEERPVFEPLQARTAVLQARLLEVRNEGFARVQVPWERRASFSPSSLESQLNKSLGGLGAQASYNPRHVLLYAIRVNETSWNQTRAALDNLTFARGTNAREDSILVFVDTNYTARAQSLSEILARVPAANASRVQFPSSELTLAFNFTNDTGFDSALATLESVAPGKVEADKRGAVAAFANVTAARQALGVGRVPERFEALVSGSARVNETVALNVFASARGKRVVSVRGEQEAQSKR